MTSNIKIKISIEREKAIPNPVAPLSPDNIYNAALPYCPLYVLQAPKPAPIKNPKTGIFLRVVFVNDTLINFYTITFICTLNTAGVTRNLNPALVM
jgi:hypothetical protein